MSVNGRTILYTGAAGGLGLETTLLFLRDGARVIAVDNDPVKADALVGRAKAEGLDGKLGVRAIDLSDTPALAGALDGLMEEFGGIDVLINNAAIYPSKPADEYTIDEYRAVQAVNVDAAIVCTQKALPGMRAKGWGRIINITSITFKGGWANLAPYIQSKGALVGLTRAWAWEFGEHGITVNAVAPGAFPTDAEKIHPDQEGYQRFILDNQAIKRRGHPGDIANALMFFASDASGFVTGQMLNVDGGWWMK